MSSPAPYTPTSRRGFPWSVKGMLLWIFLVLMFLAVYNVLTDPTDGQRTQRAVATVNDPTLATLLPMLVGLAFVGWFVWLVRRTRTFNSLNLDAMKLLADADFDGAVARYESLAKAFRRPASIRAVALYNLGVSRMRRGDLTVAQTGLEDVDRYLVFKSIGVGPSIAINLALVHALRGAFDLATTWETEATRRMRRVGDPRQLKGRLALARAIVRTRKGAFAEVVQTLETQWHELESNLPGDTLRPLRVVRAFATAHASGVREAGNGDAVLAALRPSRPGEFAALGAAWPEMSAFLATHGL